MPKCFFSTHALSNIHHQQFLDLGLGTCFLGFLMCPSAGTYWKFRKLTVCPIPASQRGKASCCFFSWPVSSLWQHRCHIFALCCETCPEACLQRVHPTWLQEVVKQNCWHLGVRALAFFTSHIPLWWQWYFATWKSATIPENLRKKLSLKSTNHMKI